MPDETMKSEDSEVFSEMNVTEKNNLGEATIEERIDQDDDKKNKEDESDEARRVDQEEEIDPDSRTSDDPDDFNEADRGIVAEDEDDDSDFGSFDDASFTELEEPEEIKAAENTQGEVSGECVHFSEEVLNNPTLFEKNLHETMDKVFTDISHSQHHNQDSKENSLLTERSGEIYKELSQIPHLQPPNWIKLNVRHNLLIKLGVPINLDEIKKENHLLQTPKVPRRKSVNEEDIKWDGFDLPAFEDLGISVDKKADLLNKTTEILSVIETDNLNNSSHQFLESSNTANLQEKLKQYNDNYAQLIELSSVWNKQLDDQKQNYEVYESVIQNLIGYSQKLKREEILAHLKNIKLKSKTKKSFWK
ncbi:unnamed protein product [Debaryomyces tyrocola]|nr:unnamed protein product [Debaryomyces tyrocola]